MGRMKSYAALLLAVLLMVSSLPLLSGGEADIKKDPVNKPVKAKEKETYPFNDDYPSLDALYSWYDELEQENSDILKKIHLGNSYEGRNIWALKVSDNVNEDEEEPAVMIDGNMHAREWSGSQVASYYLWRLVNDYDTNETIHWLVNNREIYVVPMVNPDGYHYDGDGDLTQVRNWRKNRNDSTPTDSVGIDLNRNWDIAWDEGNPDPTSNTYHGESPFSEPETFNLKEFILSKDIDSYQNLHSHYGTLLIPWAYTAESSPHYGWYRDMASDMTSMTSRLGDDSEKYSYGQPGSEIGYSAPGGSYDWVYEETGATSLCYEIFTDGTFHPSSTKIMDINQDLYDSLIYQARIANADLGDGETDLSPPSPYVVRGTLTDTKTGSPLAGKEVTLQNQNSGEKIAVKTDSNGYYEFNFATLTEHGYSEGDNFTLNAGEKQKHFNVDDSWGKRLDFEFDALSEIKIKPENANVTAGDPQEFEVTAYDQNGKVLSDVTDEVYWSDDINGSSWEGNVITPKTAGDWTVTAEYQGFEDTAQLSVEPAEVTAVMISPSEEKTIISGETLQFSAEARDDYGNSITKNVEDFKWNGVDEEGLFSDTEPGKHEVSAEYEGIVSDSVTVVVKEAVPDLNVNDFEIDTNESESSLKIEVTAEIENTGTASGKINLTDNGNKLDSWTLEKGESITIDETYEVEEGDHTVELGEKSESVTLEKLESDEETPGFTVFLLVIGFLVSTVSYYLTADKR